MDTLTWFFIVADFIGCLCIALPLLSICGLAIYDLGCYSTQSPGQITWDCFIAPLGLAVTGILDIIIASGAAAYNVMQVLST